MVPSLLLVPETEVTGVVVITIEVAVMGVMGIVKAEEVGAVEAVVMVKEEMMALMVKEEMTVVLVKGETVVVTVKDEMMGVTVKDEMMVALVRVLLSHPLMVDLVGITHHPLAVMVGTLTMHRMQFLLPQAILVGLLLILHHMVPLPIMLLIPTLMHVLGEEVAHLVVMMVAMEVVQGTQEVDMVVLQLRLL